MDFLTKIDNSNKDFFRVVARAPEVPAVRLSQRTGTQRIRGAKRKTVGLPASPRPGQRYVLTSTAIYKT